MENTFSVPPKSAVLSLREVKSKKAKVNRFAILDLRFWINPAPLAVRGLRVLDWRLKIYSALTGAGHEPKNSFNPKSKIQNLKLPVKSLATDALSATTSLSGSVVTDVSAKVKS
jgi:hypothetical protein